MSGQRRLPDVRAIAIASLDELPNCLPHVRQHFSLLLAWNATDKLNSREIEVLEELVDRGLVYFCAWGDHCELVHDAVDQIDIDRQSTAGDGDFVIMTTSHHDETLEEALWFFRYCVSPARPLEAVSYDRFAVSVGQSYWHEKMVRYFRRKRSDGK